MTGVGQRLDALHWKKRQQAKEQCMRCCSVRFLTAQRYFPWSSRSTRVLHNVSCSSEGSDSPSHCFLLQTKCTAGPWSLWKHLSITLILRSCVSFPAVCFRMFSVNVVCSWLCALWIKTCRGLLVILYIINKDVFLFAVNNINKRCIILISYFSVVKIVHNVNVITLMDSMKKLARKKKKPTCHHINDHQSWRREAWQQKGGATLQLFQSQRWGHRERRGGAHNYGLSRKLRFHAELKWTKPIAWTINMSCHVCRFCGLRGP